MDTESIIIKMAMSMKDVSSTIKKTIRMANSLLKEQTPSMKEVLSMENTMDMENFLRVMNNSMRGSFFKD